MKAYFYCTDGASVSGPVSIDELIMLRVAIKAGNRGSVISRSSRGERDRDPRGKWKGNARSGVAAEGFEP